MEWITNEQLLTQAINNLLEYKKRLKENFEEYNKNGLTSSAYILAKEDVDQAINSIKRLTGVMKYGK